MKNNKFLKLFLFLTIIFILLPIFITLIWSVTARWSWPHLFPETFSLRGMKEVFSKHQKGIQILLSSIAISLFVAIISTTISYLFVRGLSGLEGRRSKFFYLLTYLPTLIASNIFSMGIHTSFIRWGLSGNIFGVLISHLIYTIPYSIHALIDTEDYSNRFLEQANVLAGNTRESYKKVVIPIILPSLITSVTMSFIISYSQYFTTMLLGGGRVKTFATIMFPFVSTGDRTLAASYAVVFLASALLVFVIFEKVVKRLIERILRDA